MTIAKKLHLLILSVILGLASLTALSVFQSQRIATSASYSSINTVPSLLALSDASDAAYGIRINIWKYAASTDPANRARLDKLMGEQHEKVLAAFNRYEKEDISDDTDHQMLEADRSSFFEIHLHTLGAVLALVLVMVDSADEGFTQKLGHDGRLALVIHGLKQLEEAGLGRQELRHVDGQALRHLLAGLQYGRLPLRAGQLEHQLDFIGDLRLAFPLALVLAQLHVADEAEAAGTSSRRSVATTSLRHVHVGAGLCCLLDRCFNVELCHVYFPLIS
ncbi:MCP four helix bundle domain-containing protein [Herbaspirillum sp. NPDC087042]|uniref:MCP four helix bundle domain-containing protein n=1 Tax=Herbaspirillum sp. NPDC087042 TaxID=3364004 RepID=UPI00380C99FA